MDRAIVIAILEQRLPGQLLAATDQLDQFAVIHIHLMRLPGLAPEAHLRPAALDQREVAVA
ncbi:hypothetical protein D3C85_1882280 [compost metagenome]